MTRVGPLLAELRSGRLRAALDVTGPEPLPAGHPLWSAPGAFITPHVARAGPVSAGRPSSWSATSPRRYLRGTCVAANSATSLPVATDCHRPSA